MYFFVAQLNEVAWYGAQNVTGPGFMPAAEHMRIMSVCWGARKDHRGHVFIVFCN